MINWYKSLNSHWKGTVIATIGLCIVFPATLIQIKYSINFFGLQVLGFIIALIGSAIISKYWLSGGWKKDLNKSATRSQQPWEKKSS
jgi:hypothetical protein